MINQKEWREGNEVGKCYKNVQIEAKLKKKGVFLSSLQMNATPNERSAQNERQEESSTLNFKVFGQE